MANMNTVVDEDTLVAMQKIQDDEDILRAEIRTYSQVFSYHWDGEEGENNWSLALEVPR